MDAPEVHVQWKNVDICLDFQCECSDPDDALEFHLDGFTFGRFRCPRCGTAWELGHPTVTKIETGDVLAALRDDA